MERRFAVPHSQCFGCSLNCATFLPIPTPRHEPVHGVTIPDIVLRSPLAFPQSRHPAFLGISPSGALYQRPPTQHPRQHSSLLYIRASKAQQAYSLIATANDNYFMEFRVNTPSPSCLFLPGRPRDSIQRREWGTRRRSITNPGAKEKHTQHFLNKMHETPAVRGMHNSMLSVVIDRDETLSFHSDTLLT